MSNVNSDLPAVPGPHAESEPVMSTATVIAAVTAVLALVVALGLPVNDDVQAAILTIVGIAAPVVAGLLARRRAWSPASVAKVVAVERQKATQGL